ncbi:hypothetical protein [Candidatus Odyssella thessalonicensis]|uniref:hypothetical protein n=1 Tax=Candidatus Odyssella thessalonicensis TaxID=84647 RepID=UPI000225B4E4|nr:hypothetical protein [Candidatus Odyssella thessalonicensis]
MCSFFNVRAINYFLEHIDQKYGLTQQQIDKLWQLRNLLRQYSDVAPPEMDPRDVLKDSHWHEIAKCAKTALKEFEGYEAPLGS